MNQAPLPEDDSDFLPNRQQDDWIERGELDADAAADIDPRLERWLHKLGEELAGMPHEASGPSALDAAASDDASGDANDESFIGGAELARLEQLVQQARPATRPGSAFRLRVLSEAGRVHRAAIREFGPTWEQIRSADNESPTTMSIRWWHLSADGGASRAARRALRGRALVVACLLLVVLATGYPFSWSSGLGGVPVVGHVLPAWASSAWSNPPTATLSLAQVRPVWRGESNPPPHATGDDWTLVSNELEFRRLLSLGFATMALAD